MKIKFIKALLYILNSIFHANLELEDIVSFKLLIKNGIRFEENDIESIKIITREKLKVDEENVESIRLVINERLRFSGVDVESIRLLYQEGLQFTTKDISSIKIITSESIYITEYDIKPIKLIINQHDKLDLDWLSALCNQNPILINKFNAKLLFQLENIATLNRLDDMYYLGIGTPFCYSQEGEELIIDRIFNFCQQGFYVDIGACHPIRYSNTYHFYKRGWRGINIDATPGAKEKFDEIRPEDIFISVAVSNAEGKDDFYIFRESALNTFSQSLAEEYQQLGYQLLEVQQVETKKLSSLLEGCYIDKPIDFMSIDVENHELNVLQSNDWNRFRPRLLLVEILNFDLNQPDEYPVHRFIIEHGYVLFAKTFNTLLYKDAL